MTEESHQEEHQGNDQLPPTPPQIPNNEGNNQKDSNGDSDNSNKGSQFRLELPQPFIIKEQEEPRSFFKRFKTSEYISLISLCVAIYAIYMTTKIFRITDSTYKLTIAKDSINRVNDSLNRIAQNEKDSLTIDLANRSLQTQINSVKETERQFKITNRPVFQIVDVRIDTFMVGARIVAGYVLQNFGKQPAKILTTRIKVIYSEKEKLDTFKSKYLTQIDVNMYMPASPVPLTTTVFGEIVTLDMANKVKSGKGFIYLSGEIEYVSTVTEKIEGYRFNYRLSFFPDFNTKIITDKEYTPQQKRKP